MKSSWASVIAICAAVLTTGSWLPQVVKTWKSRRADDFSWAWLAAFSTGVTLWAIYGVILEDVPIIATNVLTVLLVLSIVVVKMKQR